MSSIPDSLVDKIQQLPPEKVEELQDFVDFLLARDRDASLTTAASRLSEDAFRRVWDNPEDAVYDEL